MGNKALTFLALCHVEYEPPFAFTNYVLQQIAVSKVFSSSPFCIDNCNVMSLDIIYGGGLCHQSVFRQTVENLVIHLTVGEYFEFFRLDCDGFRLTNRFVVIHH